ncbi:RNA polymerase sigma factor [Paenibacillus sp. FSL R5-0407]|uniref:RNA polymerase sigma factor n=1 Tax=Paenibacillus sp. FSL R5-0407 TaxID=2975320 RepID=UPI0030F5E94C
MIEKMRQGDRAAFREFVKQYGNFVFRAAYSVLHDEKEAEDAAQETFLQVYKSLPAYRSQGIKSWVTRIAINKAIDFKRRRDRRREEQWDSADVAEKLPAVEDDLLKEMMIDERRSELHTKISQLPPGHRQVVTAFYLDGKSYEQIASDLEQTVKTVESKLYRARAWIREHWKEEEWR